MKGLLSIASQHVAGKGYYAFFKWPKRISFYHFSFYDISIEIVTWMYLHYFLHKNVTSYTNICISQVHPWCIPTTRLQSCKGHPPPPPPPPWLAQCCALGVGTSRSSSLERTGISVATLLLKDTLLLVACFAIVLQQWQRATFGKILYHWMTFVCRFVLTPSFIHSLYNTSYSWLKCT